MSQRTPRAEIELALRRATRKGGDMTIPFGKLKARLLANPKVKAEYDALAPEFEISTELIKARLRAGLSQAELAARMGTSQSTIARLESGQTLPSTKTLLRYAEATGIKFHVRLSAARWPCRLHASHDLRASPLRGPLAGTAVQIAATDRQSCDRGPHPYSAATSSSVGHFFISTRCSYFSKFALS
jgi:transcriptional regulator with XRE-family HTH domain